MMHQGAPTTTMAYPSLPASPTLTNPDMILPYGDYDSTPSPQQSKAWKSRPQDMDFAQSLSYGDNNHIAVPMTPITPIIYGNGTMLSDIGEVTEAESTPGVGVRRLRDRVSQVGGSPVKSSPTIGNQNTIRRSKVRGHHRSVSMESSSTIKTESQAAEPFEDFDDAVSMGESAFQGDDEESVMGESYGEGMVAEVTTMYQSQGRTVDARRKENDELSSAALSKRAEIILQNAKKRLDSMEGNLSRARSSLYTSPSSSIHSSSPLSRSTPSPTQPRIISQMGVPPARHRQLSHSALGPNSPTHARIGSESSLPQSPPSYIHDTTVTSEPSQPLIPSPQFKESTWRDSYVSQNAAQDSRRSSSNEHSDPKSAIVITDTGNDGDQASPFEADKFVRSSTAEPHARYEIDPRTLARSASSMQMRDLTDKMKDLKGKISTLRDRAKEENMRRRSVQSLRAPSPFTAAEQWYTTSRDYKDGHLSADAVVMHAPWNGENKEQEIPQHQADITLEHVPEDVAEDMQEYEESETTSVYQDFEEAEQHAEAYGNVVGSFGEEEVVNDYVNEESAEPGDGTEEHADEVEQYDGQPIEEGVEYEFVEDEQYDDSEDGASLYHEAPQVPLSHEDREDAFDYEHFFLHSAMGTMSQQKYRRRGSVGSYSSDDSVQTARGLEHDTGNYKDELRPASGHKRQKSFDTISTMATFATAKERHSQVDLQNQLHDLTTQNMNHFQQNNEYGIAITSPIMSDDGVEGDVRHSRRGSVIKAGIVQPVAVHRPSVSSFASFSSSTSRSFPLINKPKDASGASTPSTSVNPSSPTANPGDLLRAALTTGIMNKLDGTDSEGATQPSPVSMLPREDQILVERIVASIGKCVIGLQETRRTSAEHRMWRKRLETAYRLLEGDESLLK